jgi:Uncharacterized conserved protein
MKDYNKSILEYSDVRDAANYAREEGFKDGKEEGVREGEEKGAKKRSLEIAKNFLRQGVSTEMIAQCTGLTSKEIETLR